MMQRIIILWQSLPGPFWMLWLGTLINRLGGFIVPFLAIYLTEARGMPVEVTGVILTMWGLGGLFGSPFGGWLADRWGRRRTMIASMLSGTVSLLALAQAVNPWSLGLGALAFGWTTSIYRPAMSAAVSDLVPPDKRVRAYGLIYWAANLGFSGASILGGLLARAGFFWLFALDALTLLIFGLIIWAKVPETRPSVGPAKVAVTGNPYADGLFMGLVLVTFLIGTIFCQNLSTLPVAMRRDGLDAAHYGALMAINGVLIVLLQPIAIRWVERFQAGHVMAVSALLVGVGFGLHHWADGNFGYAVAITVWTLGEIVFNPVSSKVVADLSPIDRRGIYQGAYSVSWTLANAVAPALGGWMMARHGSVGLWGGCLIWGMLAAIGSLALAGGVQRRVLDLQKLSATP